MNNLFEQYKFPKTRYQGSKYKLSSWIKESLENIEFDTCLDAFSGTSSIAYVMKTMNKTVYTNDILKCNYYIAKALIENNFEEITGEDINFVLTKNPEINYKTFIYDTFKEIYYLDEENEWLDIVIQNVNMIENKYKKSMILWAIFQSAISKRPYNLFHRKNLYVRTSNVERNFGNKTTWEKSFSEHFQQFIQEINCSIFDNKQKNQSFCNDIFNINVNVDLVYIDTPYIPVKGTLTYYRDFYHFLDGLSDYENWNDKIDYKTKHRKLKSEYNIWEDKTNITHGFKKLIEKFSNSKIIISYRDDGIPSIDELTNILKYFGKKVTVETIDYKYVLSKKQNSKEVLIKGV